MKKAYSKPKIFFDSFELSQSIASYCSAITNAAQYVCAVTVTIPGLEDIPELGGEMKIYNGGDCNVNPQEAGGTPCYEVPTGGWNVFSS